MRPRLLRRARSGVITPYPVLATLSLIKTDGSTVAADAIPDALGLGFKAGDIAAGFWPVLKTDGGTTIPYTAWGKNTWADGSLKRLSVLIRYPDAIAGSSGAVTNINVTSGGGAPASSSSRALSDTSAAALSMVLTGSANLTGTWTSALNTGVSDNDDVLTIGDGAVGKVVRVGQQFMAASSNHGQLHGWWYLMLLEDGAGALYGIRHLCRTMQAWCDVSSPTPTYRTYTASYKTGATEIRAIVQDNGSGSTTGTINHNHYTSWFSCGTSGKYDFIAGSRGAEAALRWGVNRAYWRKSKLIPPYDFTVTPTAIGTPDGYLPNGKGPFETFTMQTGGNREEVGVFGTYFARHIYGNGDADEETEMRSAGLSAAGWRQSVRRNSTRRIVVYNNGHDRAGSTYTAMGTSQPTWRWSPGSPSGVQSPAAENAMNYDSEYETSHRPGASYWPYMATGEPQYLDLLEEYAVGGIGSKSPGASTLGTTAPVYGAIYSGGTAERDFTIGGTTYYGVASINSQNLIRVSAWNYRDCCQLLAALPDTDPGGSAIRTYIDDLVSDSATVFNAYNAAKSSTWQASGLIMFRDAGNTAEGCWTCYGYYMATLAHGYALTEKSSILTMLNHAGKFCANIAARTTDYAQMFAFGISNRDIGDSNRLVEDIADIMMKATNSGNNVKVTPNAATDVFTVTLGPWTPTNGDRLSVDPDYAPTLPGGGVAYNDILYVVNASGSTFKVSNTLGGSAIDVTSNTQIDHIYLDCANYGELTFEGYTVAAGYLALITGSIHFAAAAGCTTLGTALSRAASQRTAAAIDFTGDPKVCFTSAFE